MTTTEIIEKPTLLKAVELVLANPDDIQRESRELLEKFQRSYPDKTKSEIKYLAAEKVISNYSYYAAFAGGATALTGVIPGLGTAVAIFGGATADTAMSMKYQIELTMALATASSLDVT